MKKILLALALLFSASTYAAHFEMDIVKFDCPDLEFSLNLSTNTVTFENIREFGVGEMIADTPIGFTWSGQNTVKVEYNWYYTTEVKLRFINKMYEMESGKIATVFFSFDDNDGIATDEPIKLACEVI